MINFLIFLLSPLLALAGVVGTPVDNTPTSDVTYGYTATCWAPETDNLDPEGRSKFELTAAMLDPVHSQYLSQPVCHGAGTPFQPYGGGDGLIGSYTRVRQNLRLTNLKVDQEGKPFNGGCGLSGSSIRWVGNAPGGQKIYWEDKNYAGQKLFDIVFVENYPPDSQAHYLDAYARNSIVENPEAAGYGFLKECKTSGGVVPVVEEKSGILPPQVIAFREADGTKYKVPFINKGEFLDNYCEFTHNPIDCPQPTSSTPVVGPTNPPTDLLFPDNTYFLIKIGPEDTGVPTIAIPKGQIGTVTAKGAAGNPRGYDLFFHLGTFYLREQKDGSVFRYDASREPPPSIVGKNPSLQLGVLQFRVVDEFNPYIPVCKPAIYLYPQNSTDVNVKLQLDGTLTESIPAYDSKKGWNVRANPDGKIQLSNYPINQLSNNPIYEYLYYEANIKNISVPKEGWVVERSNVKGQMSKILVRLGLNEKESADFLAYWVPKLSEKPYYFVTLLPEKDVNEKEQLTFSQKPDTLIRVRFLFEGLDSPISVSPLSLGSTPKRVGFTAVDWGGGVIGGNCENGVISNQTVK